MRRRYNDSKLKDFLIKIIHKIFKAVYGYSFNVAQRYMEYLSKLPRDQAELIDQSLPGMIVIGVPTIIGAIIKMMRISWKLAKKAKLALEARMDMKKRNMLSGFDEWCSVNAEIIESDSVLNGLVVEAKRLRSAKNKLYKEMVYEGISGPERERVTINFKNAKKLFGKKIKDISKYLYKMYDVNLTKIGSMEKEAVKIVKEKL